MVRDPKRSRVPEPEISATIGVLESSSDFILPP